MAQKELTNEKGLSIAMAVWLAGHEYTDRSDDAPEGELVSVTTLLKPTRAFILEQQVPLTEKTMPDVMDFFKSRIGDAVHTSIETAWTENYETAMQRLGYPQKMIDRVVVNPVDPDEDSIPVYTEQRKYRAIDGVILSGKFDLLINGENNDTKTTSVYSYIYGSNDEDHILQGSMYRWLDPEKFTSDVMNIQNIFTDWKAGDAARQKNYPPNPVWERTHSLMELKEVETWIKNKLHEIRTNIDLPQSEMIRCTDKELWKSDPQYKYYSNPAKIQAGGRATRNFDTLQEALLFKNEKGKGEIVTVPGKVRRCSFCKAFSICEQKDEYEHG